MAKRPHKGLADLVSSALEENRAANPAESRHPGDDPPQPPEGDDDDPVAEQQADPATLIDLYFDLEDPAERQVLFDRLCAIREPLVDAFLAAMAEEDEDEAQRLAATAELALRGHGPALETLEQQLEDPSEEWAFELAVDALARAKGLPFFAELQAIWRDPERPGDQRRTAMLGMEALDGPAALEQFRGFIDESVDIEQLADDQIEQIMLAFARHDYHAGRQALEQLQQRILAAPLETEEREELAAFVQEGIDLLMRE